MYYGLYHKYNTYIQYLIKLGPLVFLRSHVSRQTTRHHLENHFIQGQEAYTTIISVNYTNSETMTEIIISLYNKLVCVSIAIVKYFTSFTI